jgi:hypothetical protein
MGAEDVNSFANGIAKIPFKVRTEKRKEKRSDLLIVSLGIQ